MIHGKKADHGSCTQFPVSESPLTLDGPKSAGREAVAGRVFRRRSRREETHFFHAGLSTGSSGGIGASYWSVLPSAPTARREGTG